ncbi:hypothetical protein SARC_07891 [Sphaeroforma arctica JP610]|uniref:Thioredoxin domain-containing protein n=1 Tax=Sphaeroforma arctica JP610 TaxID=667725 RepID=A0A0L0FT11_9EUKA|nr:hypothetical protein SARC_07891 [Sphaeroforma arctica JP610]KNC79716.1 hypothetical protein SARC_07891 [Sphaeroforma arctica JP610]|eukprot:XP_014153618.1 hypothetical protein SARC_07891 [Sphaeroforma arctica JP610]
MADISLKTFMALVCLCLAISGTMALELSHLAETLDQERMVVANFYDELAVCINARYTHSPYYCRLTNYPEEAKIPLQAKWKHEDVEFVNVNCHYEPSLCRSANVRQYPTVVGYLDGNMIAVTEGNIQFKDVDDVVGVLVSWAKASASTPNFEEGAELMKLTIENFGERMDRLMEQREFNAEYNEELQQLIKDVLMTQQVNLEVKLKSMVEGVQEYAQRQQQALQKSQSSSVQEKPSQEQTKQVVETTLSQEQEVVAKRAQAKDERLEMYKLMRASEKKQYAEWKKVQAMRSDQQRKAQEKFEAQEDRMRQQQEATRALKAGQENGKAYQRYLQDKEDLMRLHGMQKARDMSTDMHTGSPKDMHLGTVKNIAMGGVEQHMVDNSEPQIHAHAFMGKYIPAQSISNALHSSLVMGPDMIMDVVRKYSVTCFLLAGFIAVSSLLLLVNLNRMATEDASPSTKKNEAGWV